MIIGGLAGAGLAVAILSLFMVWRLRGAQHTDCVRQRGELDRAREECLRQIGLVEHNLKTLEQSAQLSVELLRDGRLGAPVRARAIRMLRSGATVETAAADLGLARSEVRLIASVAELLAPRN